MHCTTFLKDGYKASDLIVLGKYYAGRLQHVSSHIFIFFKVHFSIHLRRCWGSLHSIKRYYFSRLRPSCKAVPDPDGVVYL